MWYSLWHSNCEKHVVTDSNWYCIFPLQYTAWWGLDLVVSLNVPHAVCISYVLPTFHCAHIRRKRSTMILYFTERLCVAAITPAIPSAQSKLKSIYMSVVDISRHPTNREVVMIVLHCEMKTFINFEGSHFCNNHGCGPMTTIWWRCLHLRHTRNGRSN